MRLDFIFDVETMGQSVFDCPVLDVAYAVFDWERFSSNPYSFEELTTLVQYDKLSIEEQVNKYDCKVSTSAINFWQRQEPAARKKILPTKEDLTFSDFCDNLFKYLRESGNIQYWWSRSNTFDPIILWRLIRKEGRDALLDEYLKYWRVRDIRTYIDAKFDFKTKNGFIPIADEQYWNKVFVAHDSIHDVAADILRLQAIFRAENDLEHINR